MKIASFIFCIYLSALAMMPCSDYMQSMDSNKNIQSSSQQHNNHDHDHDHENEDITDTCSPFCICACCGLSYSIENTHIKIPTVRTFSSKKIPLYNSSINSNEFLFIWKPPQIS